MMLALIRLPSGPSTWPNTTLRESKRTASLRCPESLANTPLHATTLAGARGCDFGSACAADLSSSSVIQALDRAGFDSGAGLGAACCAEPCNGSACGGLAGSGQRSCTVGDDPRAAGEDCAAAKPGMAVIRVAASRLRTPRDTISLSPTDP